jgi:predicted metal-dependent hydrolase
MKRQLDAITFGNSDIEYRIARSLERSTIAVTVNPDGAVQVVAPKGTLKTVIADAVRSKASWIIRQQEFFRRHASSQAKLFVSGESFPYLGRQYKLKVKRRSGLESPHVELSRGQFNVTLNSDVDKADQAQVVKTELTKWYRRRAKEVILPILEAYSAKVGVPHKVGTIREMKKRWGSGGQGRRLAFNWRIIMAPRRLVEYVVAHELCHTIVSDHSRDFWRLLEKVMPDYQRRRQTLAINGAKYDLKDARL